MAHTNVKNTFVGRPTMIGGIWRVPNGIALPTTAYAPRPAGCIRLGGVSDDGYTYTSERTTEKKKDWNGDKVRSIQTGKDDSFEVTFIEFLNPAVMALAYGDDNVSIEVATIDHGTHIVTRSVADQLDHAAYIVDTTDGKVKRRRVIYDAQVDKGDPIVEKPGDWSVYKLTFDMFPNAQGSTNDTYTELDDKITATSWTLTIDAATGGTFALAVNGGSPTTGVTNSPTSAALKSALEALTEVGAGNVTVTGTAPGPFAITLAKGGVLSADGTNLTGTGAAVTVTAA